MSLYENINKFIKQRGMNRKEFALKLIDLKPTLNRIGEVPSLSAIYTYLNGTASIKAELIPYIADVLDVTEQELFDNNQKTRKRCFKYFLENADKSELEYFNTFINSQINNIEYDKMVIIKSKSPNDKIEEFSSLLEYAPSNFIDKVIMKLKEYKAISQNIF